jgi:hypothetical protein
MEDAMTMKMAAITKTEGNWTRRAAIERLCGSENEALVEVNGSVIVFERVDNFDYYLVNTNDFSRFGIHTGSVIEVWTSDHDVKPGALVLIAGKGRLEIARYESKMSAQILGSIYEVKSWAGSTPQHLN